MKGRIPYVAGPVQAIIEKAQPYYAHPLPLTPAQIALQIGLPLPLPPQPPRRGIHHPLRFLKDVVNQDKHRLIPVVTSSVAQVGGRMNCIRDVEPWARYVYQGHPAMNELFSGMVVEDGAVVARYGFRVTGPQPEVRVDQDVAFRVHVEIGPSLERVVIPLALFGVLDFINAEVIEPIVREMGA